GNGAIIERDTSGPAFRLFYVSGGQGGLAKGTLSVSNLTLRGGLAQGGNGAGGAAGLGGAIFNAGMLVLSQVTCDDNAARGGTSNTTTGGGGGLAGDGNADGSGGG